MLHILYKNTKSCRGTHSRKRRGRNCCYKGKTCIWIVQGFWKKSAELEVIFNSCWVLEIQNEVSANQRGSSTNHIGRFGGLDVISGIIGDRFIDPKEWTNVPVPMTLVPMTLQHPTSVKNRLHFHTFLPKSLHNPNKCLTFAATVPATPLPWMRTTAGLRVFIEYM